MRIEPRLGERGSATEATLRWSTGDGSDGVVAVVHNERYGQSIREDLIGIAAAPAGAVDLAWLYPNSGHRLRLYRRAAWDRRAQRKPRHIAEAVAGQPASGMPPGGPSEEIAADIVFSAMVIGWVVGLACLIGLGLLVAARRLRG